MFVKLANRLYRRLADERGLSIVEVVVAALLLVLGALAVFQLVDVAARSSYRAEQSQVSSNLLQREMERVKSAEQSDMAVTLTDPNGCMTNLPSELSSRLSGSWATEGSEFDGSPRVLPEEDGGYFEPCESITTGDVTSTLYRVITWYDPSDDPEDPSCLEPEVDSDFGDSDYCGMKRILIGVIPETTASGGERGYHEIQGDVIGLEANE